MLVHVARAPHEQLALPLRALGVADEDGVRLLLGAAARVVDGELLLPGDGPAASAYLLG